jgi:hypothetical protein
MIKEQKKKASTQIIASINEFAFVIPLSVFGENKATIIIRDDLCEMLNEQNLWEIRFAAAMRINSDQG